MTAKPLVCIGAGGKPCQFLDFHDLPIEETRGKAYCPMHAPLDATGKSLDRIVRVLQPLVRPAQHGIDFLGVEFPSNGALSLDGGAGLIRFNKCKFADGTLLQLQRLHMDIEFVDSLFIGAVTIEPPQARRLSAKSIHFDGGLILNLADRFEGRFDLSGSTFKGEVKINASKGAAIDLRNARFQAPVRIRIGSEGALSQSTTFVGSHFSKAACDLSTEAGYRAIRLVFESNGNRDDEGTFYALEKRSQRRTLRLGPTRGISALYDWLSSYGSSYVKPLCWLIGVQLIAAVCYIAASPNFDFALAYSPDVLAFTLAQVVRPFELLSVKAASPILTNVVGAEISGGWAVATASHGLISLALFTLFLLAVRWRFKRS